MSSLRRRVSTLPSLAASTALTFLAALFAAIHLLVVAPGPDHRGPGPWSVLLAGLCVLALLFRTRWPLGSLLAIGVFGTLYLASGNGLLGLLPAVVIAQYSAVAYSGRPHAMVWTAAVGVAVALSGADLLRAGIEGRLFEAGALLNSGWMAMSLLLGEALRSRHAYAQEAELRAAQAERIQQEEAQRRVAEARLQIARELHDILAHTVALINVQAGVAAHVIDQRPEQAREALNHIKDASRATLQELRALVGVLREPDGPAPRSPAPGLDGLDDLIASVRDAGLTVETDVTGRDGPLPATVDVAAYRILQEALTNVLKHAGPAPVRVSVHQEGAQLRLKVTNRAGGHAPAGRGEGLGHGIAGMRERAAALGGSLQAGPLPDGGFRVDATLPIPERGGRL